MYKKNQSSKIIYRLELFYVFLLALSAALTFKSGGAYASNVPTMLVGQFEKTVAVVREIPVKKLTRAIGSKIIDPPKRNTFPWGQCTWYVATKRNVTWRGHARSWYANAKAAGRPVGNVAKIGSIIVLNQGYYGHVGYVEAVEGDYITFSESNNPVLGRITRQRVNINDIPLIGFIY